MELLTAIKNRRSVRIFEDRKIEKEVIEKIIEAGTHAPSACNVQGWRFIVIDDQEIKNKISDAGGTILIKKSPVGILATYDNRTNSPEYKDYIQSASAAIENMLLAATEMGIGCCWINHLPTHKTLRKLLNIPPCYSPIAYILIGYPLPEEKPVSVPRKYKAEEIISYNSFGENLYVEKINVSKALVRKILTRIYHLSPLFIKKLFLNKFLDKYFVKKFEN